MIFDIFGKIKREILSAEIEKLIEEHQEAEETEILFVPTKFIYPSRDFHFMKLPISALIFSRLLS